MSIFHSQPYIIVVPYNSMQPMCVCIILNCVLPVFNKEYDDDDDDDDVQSCVRSNVGLYCTQNMLSLRDVLRITYEARWVVVSNSLSVSVRFEHRVCLNYLVFKRANSFVWLQRQNTLSATEAYINPLMGILNDRDGNGPLYSNTVIGTLSIDGRAVTFGTARRALGGLRCGPTQSPLHRTKCNSPPITASVPTSYYSTWHLPVHYKGLIGKMTIRRWNKVTTIHVVIGVFVDNKPLVEEPGNSSYHFFPFFCRFGIIDSRSTYWCQGWPSKQKN